MCISVFVVGFEEQNYTVIETDITIEVCVVVANPPSSEELFFDVILEYTTRRVTAGNCLHELLFV